MIVHDLCAFSWIAGSVPISCRSRNYITEGLCILAVASGILVPAALAMGASDMIVAENGRAGASIVVGRQSAEPTRFAAEELQRVVREMTGAELPIVDDATSPPTAVIALGSPSENRTVARLLNESGTDFAGSKLGEEGFLLHGAVNGFVVVGGSPRATLYGVYALLERLGCRWCFPGKHGEIVPKTTTVRLPAIRVVERPGFAYRTFLQLEVVGERTVDWIDWMAKNRMNRFLVTLYPAKGYKGQTYAQFKSTPGLLAAIQKRGLKIEAGNHSSYYWIPSTEFYAKHPEFFALIDGKRGPPTFDLDRGQLCFSNAQVAEITAERIIRFVTDNPEADVLDLWPNDGKHYCECEACKAFGSTTDAYLVYVNRVAERFYEAFPQKKLCFLSYNDVSAPPIRTKAFGKNTICMVATWPPPSAERLKGWLASGAGEVVLYEYYMGSYSDRSFPGTWPKLIADELRQIHGLGLAGVASQCELDNWGAYSLNYWVAARKLWNPTLAMEDVLTDYFDHYYAEARDPMRKYFAYVESLGRMNRSLEVSEDSLQKLHALLAAGERAAQSEPVRVRIGRDRIALDYLRKAWTVEDARRQIQSLARAGREREAIAALRRGAKACQECLDYMSRHRDDRVFLVGAPDNPKQPVGHHYNTAYYAGALKQFTAALAQPAKWTSEEKNKKAIPTREGKVACAGAIEKAQKELATAFEDYLNQEIRKYPAKQIGPDFPRSKEEWLAFADDARRRLRSDIFHFPKQGCPLDSRTVGTIDRGDFVIEKVIYRAEPDNWVTANLYRPKKCNGRAPALICPSGHGGSKSAPYNQFFGQTYAKAGCVVLVPDPIGEEERDEQYRLAIRGHRLDYRIDRCVGLGISVIGKLLYDLVRGVDYLTSRPEVDPARIGAAGHSLGGTLTEYLVAVDPRIVLSLSAGWTPDEHEIAGVLSCCWRPVGMLQIANDPELIALGAPRCAALYLAGENDASPMHANVFERTASRKAKRVYNLFGRGDCLALDVTPDAGHQPFHVNRAALAWTEKHFGLPQWTAAEIDRLETPVEKTLVSELAVPFQNEAFSVGRLLAAKGVGPADVRILPASVLRCLRPGEEANPEFSMAGWMAARENRLAARFIVPKTKEALDARRAELRTRVAALLNLPARPKCDSAEKVRTFRHGTATVDELRYGLLGFTSFLMTPPAGESPPVAIFLDTSGVKEGALTNPRVAGLLSGGTVVLALDTTPFRESAFLIGTSPTAYSVGHVLESVELLVNSYNVDPKQVSCIGEVDDIALLAGLLDERIGSVLIASQAGVAKAPGQSYRRTGVVPGLRAVASHGELAAMLVPRRLRIEMAIPDRDKIEAVYRLAGAAALP